MKIRKPQLIFFRILPRILILILVLFPFIDLQTLAEAESFEPVSKNFEVIEELKEDIEKKQKEIEELETQAQEFEEEIGEKQKERKTLKNQINIYEKEIQILETQIEVNQIRISQTSSKIKRLEMEIENKEEEIKKQKERIGEIIRILEQYDKLSPLELILQKGDFSEVFSQIEYVGLLQQDLQETLNDLQVLKKRLEREEKILEEEKRELEELKKELADQFKISQAQKQAKENLLYLTRQSEYRFQELLEEIRKRQIEVRKEIFELEDKLKQALDPGAIPPAIHGTLNWPTEGVLTQIYGCLETAFARRSYASCNNGRGGFHNGIDIAASAGTPIRAARDGKVVASGESPYAYGNWLVIEHDNGLLTMYGHLLLKVASKGQNVTRDQVIGYMGSTGYSTGPHLHFTVYAPGTFRIEPSKYAGMLPIGASLDPINYL